jgi:membrane-associated phospholipid phosphatase
MTRKQQPPSEAKSASTLEHADARLTAALAQHRDHPVIATLGRASEVADQPPLLALTAATALAGLILRRPVLLRAGLRMLASELVATGIKTRIKHRVDRTRPHKMLDEGRYALRHAGDAASREGPWSSFPSGHTAGAVAVARALTRDIPGAAIPATIAAATVAAIQVPRAKHFPTDVIAGVAIGLAAEALVSTGIRLLSRPDRTRSDDAPDRRSSA